MYLDYGRPPVIVTRFANCSYDVLKLLGFNMMAVLFQCSCSSSAYNEKVFIVKSPIEHANVSLD